MEERQQALVEEKYLAALRAYPYDEMNEGDAANLHSYVERSLGNGKSVSHLLGYSAPVPENVLLAGFNYHLQKESLESASNWFNSNLDNSKTDGQVFLQYKAVQILIEAHRYVDAMNYANTHIEGPDYGWSSLIEDIYPMLPAKEKETVVEEAEKRARAALADQANQYFIRNCVQLLSRGGKIEEALDITKQINDDTTTFILYAESILYAQESLLTKPEDIKQTIDLALGRFQKMSPINRTGYSGPLLVEMLVNNLSPEEASKTFIKLEEDINFITQAETKDTEFLEKLKASNLNKDILAKMLIIDRASARRVRLGSDRDGKKAAEVYRTLCKLGLKDFALEVLVLDPKQVVTNFFEEGRVNEAIEFAEEHLNASQRLSVYQQYLPQT